MLEAALLKHPRLGTPLGSGAYKIRLKIKSKGEGESGGARVISYLEKELVGIVETEKDLTVVNLITIYDKSELESITDRELKN